MKILITTFSFPVPKINHFGATFVAGEAIAYAKNGAKVIVLTPFITGSEKIEQLQENINVIRFRYFWPNRFQTLLQPNQPLYSQKSFFSLVQVPFVCFFFMLNILKYARQTDIIHAQWTLTALLALPAKWLFKTKIVLTARGSDISLLPQWLNRFIHRQVNGAIDCFGPQTWNEEYKKKFKATFIQLPLIVHNNSSDEIPDDLTPILHRNPELFIIVYIGRFDYQKIKDHKLPLIDMIHAGHALKEVRTDFHIIYLGDGEAVSEMRELIQYYQLDNFVSLLGPKNDVFAYIRHCHLGVGGVALNGVSEELTISEKPQLLVEGGANANTPWIKNRNALFFQGENRESLVSILLWAMVHKEELVEIGKRAKTDLSRFITDSEQGGKLYIDQFQKTFFA